MTLICFKWFFIILFLSTSFMSKSLIFDGRLWERVDQKIMPSSFLRVQTKTVPWDNKIVLLLEQFLNCLDSWLLKKNFHISYFFIFFQQTEQFTVLWILFAVIVLGNSAVLVTLFINKSRKSRMNFFIKHLAIAGNKRWMK